MLRLSALLLCLLISAPLQAQEDQTKLRKQTAAALKKACAYYRSQVASHGGYVYYNSVDLKQRWGEGKATVDDIFVQPPGTPTVGMAYLEAYHATGDKFYLNAARETAEALIQGQLQSGGWAQVIHFGKAKRLGKYRQRKGGSWNMTSLDDDQTQSALQFLMLTDKAMKFKDEELHEAVEYGLHALLKAQFANGAFPQGWRTPASKQPILPAKYPDYDWRTENRIKNYWDYYTLNDGIPSTVASTLIQAHDVYGDEKYLKALKKLGDFLVLAQMPDPQPAWCQQYNYDMIPMWARKFEPPAISGWESQDAMRTLIRIADYTKDKKYLEPIPAALKYLKKSVLPDGKVARFYELRSNRPLYMNQKYELTYDDDRAPGHYGWKQPARLEQIAREYQRVKNGNTDAEPPRYVSPKAVRKILDDMDVQGRWVSTYHGERLTGQPRFPESFRYISSAVFSRNVTTLSAFLQHEIK